MLPIQSRQISPSLWVIALFGTVTIAGLAVLVGLLVR
jgi:hypothetical protein